MKTVKIGFKKEYATPDGFIAEYWQLSTFSNTFNERLQTDFSRYKIWKQVLILYKDLNSFVQNKMSTGISKVINIPFWVSDVNNSDWNLNIIERIQKIDSFFADADVISYEVDETLNQIYEFTKEGIIYVMQPNGNVLTKQEYEVNVNSSIPENQIDINLVIP